MTIKQGETYTRQFVVTEAVFSDFQRCSGDRNPLHTDERYALDRGFQGRVMYGNILNAFLSFFVGEMLPAKNVVILSQDIAFKNPVYMGESLAFTAVAANVSEAVKAVEFKYSFQKPDGKTAAKGTIQVGELP